MPAKNHVFLIFLLIFFLAFSCRQKPGELELVYVETDKVEDIVEFRDTLVKPIEYVNLISLDELPVQDRKQRFIQQILPSILICKYKLETQREQVQKILKRDTSRISKNQKRLLDSLYMKYRASTPEELLRRIQTHPVSIVLAQAALESAWGTSRFYSEGKNVFGIWSFNENDNRMASRGKRDGEHVYLKKYHSLTESIEDYFLVLGRGPFKDFRHRRMETKDPYVLINLLTKYSEKEKEYARLLRMIIKKNNLTQYDRYRIDPEFIH